MCGIVACQTQHPVIDYLPPALQRLGVSSRLPPLTNASFAAKEAHRGLVGRAEPLEAAPDNKE